MQIFEGSNINSPIVDVRLSRPVTPIFPDLSAVDLVALGMLSKSMLERGKSGETKRGESKRGESKRGGE